MKTKKIAALVFLKRLEKIDLELTKLAVDSRMLDPEGTISVALLKVSLEAMNVKQLIRLRIDELKVLKGE